MSSIEETAYPRLHDEVTDSELERLYTPTAAERGFVNTTYRLPRPRACLMLQLKLVQRLGYAVPLADVPVVRRRNQAMSASQCGAQPLSRHAGHRPLNAGRCWLY